MNEITYLTNNRGEQNFELFYQCTYFLNGMDYFDTGSSGQGFYSGIGGGAVVEGELDLNRVERVMQRLFDEIDTLRVCYPAAKDDSLHFKIRADYDFKLEVLQARGASYEERLQYASNEESRIVADLQNYTDITCRAVVYDLADGPSGAHAWLIALTFNHMIIDDQGLILVWDQFMRYYRGETKRCANVKSLVDYFNFINDNPDLYDRDAIISYWKQEMSGYKTPEMCEPEGMEGVESFDLADYVVFYDILHLRRVAAACKVTLPALFVSAFHVASAETFGARDSVVTLGTEARPNFEYWSTVVHSLVSINNRMDVRDDETFADFAHRTMVKMSENIKNAPAQQYVGGISHLCITYANQPPTPNLGDGLTCHAWMPDTVLADNRTDASELVLPPKQLMMGIVELGDTVRTLCGFTPLSFSMADAKSLSGGMERCLRMLDENSQITVGDILAAAPATSRLRFLEPLN
ncbi:MAG: condensation domain-containing protein [Coriobacteriales bacterium]|jgi:hypothetical protein|nr:condensation domain-containing protein [Coriobacteriales bacterium]